MVKLNIQFIPTTTVKNNVRSAVSEAVWECLRNDALREAGDVCEVCGSSEDLEVHEEWTWIYGLPNTQRLQRLRVLCNLCHSCVHIGVYNRKRLFTEELEEHLLQVNGWTQEEYNDAYDSAVCLAVARSQVNWWVDISVLDDAIRAAEKFIREVEVTED